MRKPLDGGSEALQALLDTITKIDSISLDELDRAVEAKRTVKDRFTEELSKGVLKAKKPKKPGPPFKNGRCRQHWRSRKKYLKNYHKTTRAPKTRDMVVRTLSSEGWYGYMCMRWKKRKIPVEVTREEWEAAVGLMENVVPFIERFDTSKGISLDNILIRDRTTRVVVFDGAEYSLRKNGSVL